MNAHTPFDANQDWSNPYCRNSSNDPMVDALLGNAYHVVRTVYCNLGYIKHLYDFLSKYGVVICVQSEAELKTLTTEAKYARIYDKSPAGDRRVTDYLYVDDDRTGILPDDTTATGSWVKVATSNSGVDSKDGGYIPWVYNSGSANGGETSIHIPDETAGAPFMIVNGDWQTEGYDFEYDPLTFEIKFTTPLEQGDFVVVMRTGVPATPDNPNISDWVTINWLYNHGAAVGGEQVIDIPYTFQSVPAVYKNGLRFSKGLANNSYTIDPDNNRIILTEPLSTNDRLVIQLGGEAKVLETVDHTIQEVARVANVKDSEVILSTDATQVLNGKKVVYSVSEQKAYGLPVLPTNVYIQSVANGKLTYSPGNVVVDLLPAPSPLRNELASGIGANMIGINIPMPGGVPRTLMQRAEDCISVRDFGAKGDGVTNDTLAIKNAIAALNAAWVLDGVRRYLVFPPGSYRTTETIVISANIGITCMDRVVFQNFGTDKSFPCVELQGGAKASSLGVIDAYGAGILIRGSTHNVTFQTISNCIDAVIFRADTNWAATKSSLDNRVVGVQIGKCTNGIVFEQNADKLVQQGNEVRVNFISETPNSSLFRNFDGFAHTVQSNWDSNYIELVASDPVTAADTSMVRNTTPHPVPNLVFKVLSWCGGWTPDAGTMCLIRGRFSNSSFTFNLASRIGLNELVDSDGKNSMGSCSVSFVRHANLGSATTFYTGVPPSDVFNGGVPISLDKFRIRVSCPDIAAGATYGSSFRHVLSQVSGTARFRVEQYTGGARGKQLIEVQDAGAESQGLVRLWITNISGATITARNVDIVVAVVHNSV